MKNCFRYGTKEAIAAQMAWSVERPFFPEEVRQAVVGSKEVIQGSEKNQTTDKRKIDQKARQNSELYFN
jgi:hypothetical protein